MLQHRILVTFLVIFFTCLSVLQAKHVVIANTPSSDDSSIRAAKVERVLKYMNVSADPCDDFYKFACGHWHIHNAATKENRQTNVFEETKRYYGNLIGTLLSNNDTADKEIMQKPKNLYRSCMNVSQVKSVYREKLIEIVSEFGKMPLLEGDKWQANEFDWLKTIAEIAYKYDRKILLGFSINVDPQATTIKRLMLKHFDFPLQTLAMYLNETNQSYRDEYQEKVATDLRDFLGVAPNAAQQTAVDIMELTISLAKGADNDTTPRGEKYKITTLDDLQEKYEGRLDVKKLMKLSLGSVSPFKVIEVNPGYQKTLIDIINRDDKRKIANFIFYYLLRPFMTFAREPTIPLQEHCIAQTRSVFLDLIENMMHQKLNITQSETIVRNMFADLKSVFKSGLTVSRCSWMSRSTRAYAKEKLRKMTIQIESYNNIDFDQKYGNLTIVANDFIANLKSIYNQRGVETRAKINGPAEDDNPTRLRLGPVYYPRANRVHIPIITLLPNFLWSASYPTAVNFGQLGFLIGHEIVHAFDDVGRRYDNHGDIRNWWDAKSERAFINRTQCFIDQYKQFIYGGKPLPEQKVQSENIADNSGLRLAYEAYTTWYNSPWHPGVNVDMETLESVPFSSSQLFFISCAQQWCTDTHPYYMNKLTSTDNHTPSNLRIIGSFSNMKQFAEAFQCPSGSGMNPVRKCEIYL